MTRRFDIRGFLRSTAGNAAVEFGVAAPLLAMIVLGVADLGMMANKTAVLDAAVRAGTAYARSSPSDTSTTRTIVQNFKSFSPAVTATATSFWECDDPNSTSIGTQSTSEPTCGSGLVAAHYVQVAATQNFSPILPFSSFVFPGSLSSTVTTRVQ